MLLKYAVKCKTKEKWRLAYESASAINMSSHETIRALFRAQDNVMREFCSQVVTLKRHVTARDPEFANDFEDSLFIHARGVLRKELMNRLLSNRNMRGSLYTTVTIALWITI